jgi:hypothetical protein
LNAISYQQSAISSELNSGENAADGIPKPNLWLKADSQELERTSC